MAKLQVTLDFVGIIKDYITNSSQEVPLQRTAEVYVDLYTRGVYNVDGVYLGTTHLWLPANLNNNQEVTIWEEDSKTITIPVMVSEQGKQYTFKTGNYVTIKDNILTLAVSYDLDTGLGVGANESGGQGFQWDPIFAAVGIADGTVGVVSETNISLGPEHSTIYWDRILYYVIIPVAIILLAATLIIKRRRKKN